ncbi:MAG TPA: hypothetical protein VI381_07065 [Allosphingosinicella sp.]
MSRIPKNAMKHAGATGDTPQMEQGGQSEGSRWSRSQMSQQMSEGASRVAERVRGNPTAALAIGAGVIGAAAAAAPLFRWGRNAINGSAGSKAKASGGGKSGGSRSKRSR